MSTIQPGNDVSANQLQALVQCSVDGLLVVDPEGIVRFANPSAAAMLARTVDDLTGFQLGLPSVSPDIPTEITIPLPLGQQAIVELRAAPIPWQGRDCMLVSLRDVTGLKITQEALRQQRDFAENLIKTAPSIILQLDPEGHIVRFNPYMEELSGYRLEEVQGKDWFATFLPEKDRSQARNLFKQAVQGIHSHGHLNIILKRDGSEIFVEWYDKSLHDENDNFLGLLSIGQDITPIKKVIKELEESRERYELAVDGINDGIWDRNLLTGDIYFSPRWKKMLGYEDHELPDTFDQWQTRIHPDDVDRVGQTLNDYQEGKTEQFRLEHRLRHRDGSYRWILSRGVCLRDADGRAYRMAGSHTDITNRKKAQEKLRNSEKLLTEITENMYDLVTMADLDGNWLYASPSHERITGYSPEYLKGRQVLEFVHPEDKNFLAQKLAGIQKTSGPQSAIYRYRIADGSLIWLETIAKLLVDRQESPQKIICSSRDVSQRVKIEQQLEKAYQDARVRAEELERLLDTAKLIAEEGDYDRIIKNIFETTRKITGAVYGYLALVTEDGQVNKLYCLESGNQVSTVKDDLSMPLVDIQIRACRDGRALFDNDFMAAEDARLMPAEHLRLSNILIAPVMVGERALGLIALAGKPTDFTNEDIHQVESYTQLAAIALKNKFAAEERNRLEAQLFQAQKMESIGRLAGGVAHDFNNLLTVIQGFSDLIHESLGKEDPLQEDVGEIRKAARSATSLTSQLLAFSRKQIIAPKVLNLNTVISGSEKMLQRLIGEDIELLFSPDPDLGQVYIDPGQVDQILVNLAVNARDAMPRGGKLTFETQNVTLETGHSFAREEDIDGDFILLAIADTGFGIPPEIIKNIFDPFFTTKPRGKGTGLGLSTIYGIVKQNNGYINVYSEPGHGTTFKVYLPRVGMEAEESEKKPPAAKLDGSETIMLVEDQDLVRRLAKRVLERRGYTVIEAEDGVEAIAGFKQLEGKIDLLLTDVVMPHMSGKELYTHLQNIDPDLKALFMSGYTENAIAHHGVLEQNTNFIHKPFRPDDLAAKVREILDSAASKRKKE